jgi:hypothetical protein
VSIPASVDQLIVLRRHRSIGLTLKEKDGLVGDEIACQVLRGIDTTDNGGTSKISALEKFEQIGRYVGLLIDDSSHHSHSLGSVDSRSSTETLDGSSSLVQLALAD